MADEKEVVKDGQVESTSTSTQVDPVKAPVGEQPTTKTPEKEVPYDRFQEVIKQKNEEKRLREQYEAKIKELEGRLPNGGSAAPDRLAKRLVDGGLKEEVAKLIAETAREANKEALAPLEAREKDRQINDWVADLKKSDPSYSKLKPQLEKAFDALSAEDKAYAVSSPKGLEWFYKSVKSDALGDEITKARAEGVKEGYENKSKKEGLSSNPQSGSAVAAPLTFESIREGSVIRKMSRDEFTKRQSEINAIIAAGPSRK